ncbi:hypothetical protein K0A97_00250 [Patescibacteria group bacterium]|nr:hypothetical protein [Patescibacteria group bacterium]
MAYEIAAIFGLVLTIIGTFLLSEGKIVKKNYIYPFLLLGGILILFYSILIKERVFIILKSAFITTIIYEMIKLNLKKKK